MSLAAPAQDSTTLFDVVVLGGGLVGAFCALAMARDGVRVALVDRQGPETQTRPDADGRASAVALGVQRMFAACGAWDGMARNAGAIHDIRVTDGPSRLFVHYDHRAVGTEPFGWIVENRDIRLGLHQGLAAAPSAVWIAPAEPTAIRVGAALAEVDLADGRTLRAPLVVGAEGRASLARETIGAAMRRLPYGQTAVVASVRHQHPHHNVAHERFLPPGPFAILPLGEPNLSSLVWTAKDADAPLIAAMDEAAFCEEMQARFGPQLGAFSLASPRFTYPLSAFLLDRITGPRIALVGDAAHGMHPIAGQGANLGWRDAAVLAEEVVDRLRLGLDVGAPELLARYERRRRPDIWSMVLITDGLNRLFANDVAPLRVARRLGLGLVERLPAAKNLFTRHAMGVLGDQPRLAKSVAAR